MTERRRGDENIMFDGMATGYHLSDFWEWAFSDLLNNTLRGAYCEFIVATALDLDLDSCRTDWSAWDLTAPLNWSDGREQRADFRVEVKSAAYLQSWSPNKVSRISFSIQPTRAWSADDGYSDSIQRNSDVYVFGLYAVTDPSCADPTVLDGWQFYVVNTNVLNDVLGDQKTISLPSLQKLCEKPTDYHGLKSAVYSCVRGD